MSPTISSCLEYLLVLVIKFKSKAFDRTKRVDFILCCFLASPIQTAF